VFSLLPLDAARRLALAPLCRRRACVCVRRSRTGGGGAAEASGNGRRFAWGLPVGPLGR
jgi:hypothetical protein